MAHVCDLGRISGLSLTLCAMAMAMEDDGRREVLVVTPDRTPERAEASPFSLRVLTREDIAALGQPARSVDLLRSVPGVAIDNTGGGAGGVWRVGLRGTTSKDALVLLDGIPLADPTGTQRQPDLGAVAGGGLEQIEVLLGAQSGLYGSDALGGVVHLRTLRPTSEPRGQIRAETGSFAGGRGLIEATGPLGEDAGYAASLDGAISRGFSAQTDVDQRGRPGGHEDDGVRSGTAHLRVEGRVRALSWWASGHGQAADREFDGYNAQTFLPDPDDADSHQVSRTGRLATGVRLGEELAGDGSWTAELLTAYTWNRRVSHSGGSETDNHGSDSFTALRVATMADRTLEVAAGVDVRRQQLDIQGSNGHQVGGDDADVGLYAQLDHEADGNRLNLSLRQDLHSRDGDAGTFRFAAGRRLAEGIELHGSVATGHRSPSLYELHGSYAFLGAVTVIGNRGLKPESSTSYEVGIEAMDADRGLAGSATLFQTRWQRRIVYDSTENRYENRDDDSRITGVELTGGYRRIGDPLSARLWLTVQDSDDGRGGALPYVPAQQGGVHVAWSIGQVGVWTQVLRTGRRFAGESQTDGLSGQTLLSAGAEWRIRDGWTVFVRGENLTGERHETYANEGVFGSTYAVGTPRSGVIGAGFTW